MKQERTGFGGLTPAQYKRRGKIAGKLLPFSCCLPLVAGVMGFNAVELTAIVPAALALYKMTTNWNAGKKPFRIKKHGNFKERTFVYLGKDEAGEEFCIPFEMLLRHMLLLGTTGSGKTTLIRKMLYSIMMMGGGATFIDGKSDTTDTYEVFCQIVQECNRQDDFYVLNLLNPEQSNSINPLLYGDSDFCTELCAGFLDTGKGGGNDGYFQGRGLALMRGLMSVLVWQRDNEQKNFTFWDIKTAMDMNNMVRMAVDIESGKIPLKDVKTNAPIGTRLMSYLDELGPWKLLLDPSGKGMMIADQVIKQHGFAVQQWSAALDLMGGSYHAIFCTEEPDIDMLDIISNGRILYVLLPSLGKSEVTLQQMGKLILSIIKASLYELLGKDTIGDTAEVKKKMKAMRPALPHLCILDEYGSYPVKGMSTVLAQARSLDYAVCVSAQELGRLYKEQEEGDALVANTNIKIIMKLEDEKTSKIIINRCGKEWRMMQSGIKRRDGILSSTEDAESYAIHEKERLDMLDFVRLKPGEAFVIFEDTITKIQVPYIHGRPVERLGLLRPVFWNQDIIKNITSLANNDDVIPEIFSFLSTSQKILVPIDERMFTAMWHQYDYDGIFFIFAPNEISGVYRDAAISRLSEYIEFGGQMYSRHYDELVHESMTSMRIREETIDILTVFEKEL